MVVVIGSEALRHHGIEIPRSKLDIDIIATLKEGKQFAKEYFDGKPYQTFPMTTKLWIYKTKDKIIEHNFPIGTNRIIYEFCKSSKQTHISPELALAIKLSHRFKKTNKNEFLKTMSDIKLLRSLGFDHYSFDAIRKQREKEVLSYSHPILNKSKEEFFTDDVGYVYDHDTIHESIKLLDKPAYQYFKPEDKQVLCSKKMFFSLDDDIKLQSVIEETWVLTIERALVPFEITEPTKIKDRYRHALQKVCTSITSGWFREYSWENYDRVLEKFSLEYFDKFKEGLSNGTIKPFKS